MKAVSDIRIMLCTVDGECHLVGNSSYQLLFSNGFGKEERSDFQSFDRSISIKTGITENWEISSWMVKWTKRRITHPMNAMAMVAVVATVQHPLYSSPPMFDP